MGQIIWIMEVTTAITEAQMHKAIRQSVQENIDRNVECIIQKMLGRGGRVVQSCSVGDVVRLRIPGVDRTRLDRKFLPGKVLEIGKR
jgi:hypothetical protein